LFKKILLAVDGSEPAGRAAKLAGEMARFCNSDLLIVTAFSEVAGYLGQPNFQDAINERMFKADEILKAGKEAIGEIKGNVSTTRVEGSAADVILNVAEARGADLIIMGVRGEGGLRSLLLGSQSQKVISHSTCPVMLVN